MKNSKVKKVENLDVVNKRRKAAFSGEYLLTVTSSTSLYGNNALTKMEIPYYEDVFRNVFTHFALVKLNNIGSDKHFQYGIVLFSGLAGISSDVCSAIGIHKITYRKYSCILTNVLFRETLAFGKRPRFCVSDLRVITLAEYADLGELFCLVLEHTTDIAEFEKGEMQAKGITKQELLAFKAKALKLQKKLKSKLK